jgi:hypothetical protein
MQGLFNHDALNDIEAWILRHTNNHQIEKLENFHPRQDIYKFTQPDGSIKISWGSSIQIAIQALSNRLGADELEAIDFSNPEKIDQKTLPAIVDRLK